MQANIEKIISGNRFRNWLQQAIFLPILAGAFIAGVFLFQINVLEQSTLQIDHADMVIGQAAKVEGLLIDAETGVRGYLVGLDKIFLEPYEKTLMTLPGELSNLQNLVANNSAQMEYLKILKADANDVMTQLHDFVAGDPNTARGHLLRSKQVMDRIRRDFEQFIEKEHRLRLLQSESALRSKRTAMAISVAMALVFAFILAFRTRKLMFSLMESYSRSLGAMEDYADDLNESREWLSTTLTSIGDAVIVVTEESIVDFLNPIAEKLTGWTLTEAKGQPMADVFNIINESTRGPAVNPVERVIQEGVIVGLANHTVLVSRDGEEYPIEDSAAPIRDRNGHIRGVVLVFRDVTEKHFANMKSQELTISLVNAVAEAQKAVRARDEFLSIASHELKTPLTSLKLQNQMFADGLANEKNFDSGTLRQMADLNERQVNQLTRLVNDMLDVSRIVSGKMQYQMKVNDLSEIVISITKSASTFLGAAKVPFQPSIQTGVMAYCDEVRIQQVLMNLVSNALKYGDGKPIEISLKAENGGATIQIRDHGIGISPADRQRIFERFERAVPEAEISGLGLGLFISRQIVEAHKGRIEVASELGKGSTFTVHLPPRS